MIIKCQATSMSINELIAYYFDKYIKLVFYLEYSTRNMF